MDDSDSGMFEPGSSLPGVQHTGGFSPTQYQQLQNILQRQQSNSLATYVLANDPRALAATSMAARAIGGNNGAKWMNSDIGKGANLAMSAAINSGMVFNTGGNSLDLMFGIQQAASRGMRANVMGGAANQFFAGRGMATDMVSKQLYDSTMQGFYGPMGAANLRMTQGYDRGGVGQAFAALGERGAFAGMNVGTLKTMADGKTGFELDERAGNKIKDLTARALKTVRILTDITGNTNVKEMMRMAETVTGASFTESGGSELIRAKLNHITQSSDLLGLNSQEVMNRIAGFGGGAGATNAVLDAALASSVQAQQRSMLSAAGQFSPSFSQDTLSKINYAGHQALGSEQVEIGAAMMLMQNTGVGKAASGAIQKHIAAITGARSLQDEFQARAGLARFLTGADGGSDLTGGRGVGGVFMQAGGFEGIQSRLSGANNAIYSEALRGVNTSRLQGMDITDLVLGARAGATETGLDGKNGRARFNEGELLPLANILFNKMDSPTSTKLIAAMKGGASPGKIAEIMSGAPGFDSDAERNGAAGSFSAFSSKYKKAGEILSTLQAAKLSDPLYNTEGSAGDKALQQKNLIRAKLDASTFGSAPAEGANIIQTILRGMAGATNFGEVQTLQYMKFAKDKSLMQLAINTDPKTGVKTGFATADTLAHFTKIAGLADALGVSNDAASIQGAIQKKDGFGKLLSFMESKGIEYHAAAGDDGRESMVAAEHDDADRNAKRLERDATENMLKDVLGVNADSAHNIATAKFGKDAGVLGAMETLDGRHRFMQALSGDPNSVEGKSARMFAEKNKDVMHAFLEKTMELNAEGAKKYREEGMFGKAVDIGLDALGAHNGSFGAKTANDDYEAAKAEKSKLDAEGSAGDMIGTVKMIIDDGVIMQLYKQKIGS
jgi:hypothetical protein